MCPRSPARPLRYLCAADAGERELTRAYEQFSAKNHPSKGGDPFVFEKVTAAYDLLMKDQKSIYQPTSKAVGYEGQPI